MVIAELIPLAVFAVIVWLIARALWRRNDDGADNRSSQPDAAALRRLFVYGLLLATLLIAAAGVIETVGELIDRSDDVRRSDDRLAEGLAMMIIGLPAFAVLARFATRTLATSAEERHSTGWMLYVDGALVISLVAASVTTHTLVYGLVGARQASTADLVAPAVWGAVWAAHWFGFRARYGVAGDLDLASGATVGLAMTVIGGGGVAATVLGEVYDALTGRGLHDGDLARWAVVAGIGAVVWFWYWWRHYRAADRTALWHIVSLLLGALGGLAMAIAGAASAGYWTLVWLVGNGGRAGATDHFTNVPTALGIAAVGFVAWAYHRWEFGRLGAMERSDPVRAYDHLMAGAGLVASIVGATVAVVALIEAATPEPEFATDTLDDPWVLAIVLAAIGLPLWGVVWRRIQAHLRRDPSAELTSPVRRVYLITLFGTGGAIVLGSGIVVLIGVLEDLLAGTFGGESIRAIRVGIGLLVTVTGVAAYHLAVFRSDHAASERLEGEPRPPTIRAVVFADKASTLPAQLAAGGIAIEHWATATGPRRDLDAVDVDTLAAEARAQGADTGVVAIVAIGTAAEQVIPLAEGRPTVVPAAVGVR